MLRKECLTVMVIQHGNVWWGYYYISSQHALLLSIKNCKTFHNIYIENKSVGPLSVFCFTHWNLRECLNLNISKTYKDKSLKSSHMWENTNKNFWNEHCRRGKFWIIYSQISQYCKIKHGEYVSMLNSQKSQTWKKRLIIIQIEPNSGVSWSFSDYN